MQIHGPARDVIGIQILSAHLDQYAVIASLDRGPEDPHIFTSSTMNTIRFGTLTTYQTM